MIVVAPADSRAWIPLTAAIRYGLPEHDSGGVTPLERRYCAIACLALSESVCIVRSTVHGIALIARHMAESSAA